MRIPVFDSEGRRTQQILQFDEQIFGTEVRRAVLKESILMYEARQRVGTSSTKMRGECAGSGRKLWRQKGTGRARVGPLRAPHWKGGGVAFGPKPRDYSYSIPKKARMVAMDSAWLAKFQDKEILILESFDVQDTPKTSVVFKTLDKLGVIEMNTIVGIPSYAKGEDLEAQAKDPLRAKGQLLWKSLRNIPRINAEQISLFNPHILLRNERVVLLRAAFEELIQSRGGKIEVLDRSKVYA